MKSLGDGSHLKQPNHIPFHRIVNAGLLKEIQDAIEVGEDQVGVSVYAEGNWPGGSLCSTVRASEKYFYELFEANRVISHIISYFISKQFRVPF